MKQVIDQVAEQFSLTKKLAGEVVAAVIEGVARELKADGKVKVKGLGTFTIKEKAARKGRNPQTGEEIQIAAKKAIGFKAEKALVEEIQ